ncbi:hypothetical protein ACRRTK_002381 [Alexandromys fortis]
MTHFSMSALLIHTVFAFLASRFLHPGTKRSFHIHAVSKRSDCSQGGRECLLLLPRPLSFLILQNLHLEMDGDRDRDPHWSTGLSSQCPKEEQNEGKYEQRSQDHEGCTHPRRQWG